MVALVLAHPIFQQGAVVALLLLVEMEVLPAMEEMAAPVLHQVLAGRLSHMQAAVVAVFFLRVLVGQAVLAVVEPEDLRQRSLQQARQIQVVAVVVKEQIQEQLPPLVGLVWSS